MKGRKNLKSRGATDGTGWIWGIKKGLKAYDVITYIVELNFSLVADLK